LQVTLENFCFPGRSSRLSTLSSPSIPLSSKGVRLIKVSKWRSKGHPRREKDSLLFLAWNTFEVFSWQGFPIRRTLASGSLSFLMFPFDKACWLSGVSPLLAFSCFSRSSFPSEPRARFPSRLLSSLLSPGCASVRGLFDREDSTEVLFAYLFLRSATYFRPFSRVPEEGPALYLLRLFIVDLLPLAEIISFLLWSPVRSLHNPADRLYPPLHEVFLSVWPPFFTLCLLKTAVDFLQNNFSVRPISHVPANIGWSPVDLKSIFLSLPTSSRPRSRIPLTAFARSSSFWARRLPSFPRTSGLIETLPF